MWHDVYPTIAHDLPLFSYCFLVQVGGPGFFLYWASGIHQPVGHPKWLFSKGILPKNILNSDVGKLW